MLRRVIYWAIFFFTNTCFGQAPLKTLYFDHLTIKDGLSHNSIFCILQDRHGFIWIGTQNGLNKYDGYDFEIYRSVELNSDEDGFIGKTITSIFEDKAGNLWVGTRKNGINYKSRSTDQFQNLKENPAFSKIKGYVISSFFEDKAENIWITTVGAGILKYNPITSASKLYNQESSGLSSDVTFDIVEDKYGTIWAAAAGGGICYLTEDDQFLLSHEMLPNHPNMGGYRKKMLLDDEYLWVATEGTGLYKMNLKDRTYIHFAPGNGKRAISSYAVRNLYKTEDGKLFIATDGKGLNIYDNSTEAISTIDYEVDKKYGLNSNALLCMMGDRSGNIWIGTYNGGINIYKPDKTWFEFFTPSRAGSNNLQHRSILSIYQSSDSTILIGTDGGGLNRLNQKNNQFLSPSFRHDPKDNSSIAGDVVKTIFEDSRNRLWVGMFGAGLDLYHPETNSFQHIIDAPINVWSIAERKNGELLIATMGNGISIIDPTTLSVNLLLPDAVNTNIMTVFVDEKDRVWIGTEDEGLSIWEEAKGELVHHRFDPNDSLSISNDEIRTIFQDSSGEIWIGTEGSGLNRWLGEGRFERIGTKEGLIANSVMAITEDAEGLLWISTFEGISRFDKRTRIFQNFDFRTLLNNNQFNQNAIIAAQSGKLFFGGIDGLNAIHPGNVVENDQSSNIIFTDIKIYNKSIPVGKLPDGRVILDQPIESSNTVWLSYLDQSFTIDFMAVDFTKPVELQFAYKMEGFNEDWQSASPGQHSVTYTNLDPGSYVFKIKHKDKQASIRVNIKPPYWQALWFKIAVVLLSAIILFSGIYFWMKRREAAHKRKILQLENEKLATEVITKNSKLMYSAVQMAHKNEILTEIKGNLKEVQQNPDSNFRTLVRKLDRELMSEDYWKEFNLYFNEVDKNFLSKILEKHPGLTQNDLRMCSLLRINLSTKEIASLLNISNRAVEQGRYRLKKRLGLNKDDNLTQYITSFHSEG